MNRLTEKPSKPIAGLHPFVVLGSPNCLGRLRDLGLETFDPIIDEQYDRVVDRTRRMELVLEELDRLCSPTLTGLQSIYEELWPRVQHNYEHLIGAFSQIGKDEVRLVNALIDIWNLKFGRTAPTT